ncbi:MAG TPA: FAD-binding oxidoreductase [Allosphingosinicella sp.]|nr:FAD-binding oxidoreductase [Allosphingosinicella sp.]
MMNKPPMALLDALASLLGAKGFTRDPDAMAPWLEDWRGRYKGAAAAMLSPAGTAEVAEIVRLCAQTGVAIVPQGGNTSMVGGATPDAGGRSLLLSLRRMNRIRAISAPGNSAVCEAGVILATLHDAAAAAGRRFPLSLGAKGSATIGGLVSTNAGGTQVLRFGTMRGLVTGIEAVLPDGSLFDGIAPLKKDNRGYDLRQLLIGAEGTLGVVTAASLKLVPAIAVRSVAWVGLGSPQAALALLRLLEERTGDAVESFELVPRNALDLVLAHVDGTRRPLAASHAWNVLVEAVSAIPGAEMDQELASILAEASQMGLVEDAALAASGTQADAFWRLRESISEAERIGSPGPRHDISVPVDAMPDFMVTAAAAVEARFAGAGVVAFGHLGDGNVHFNVGAPAGEPAAAWIAAHGMAVTAFVDDLVTAAGGSISAEHGIGQARLEEFQRLGEPARLHALRAIKHALDPMDIMNPGKLVPLADPPRAP